MITNDCAFICKNLSPGDQRQVMMMPSRVVVRVASVRSPSPGSRNHSYFNNQTSQEMREMPMQHLRRLWSNQEGQDIAEYAVMLAVILVIVVGTIRLIGSSANNVFSNVASSIQ